MSEGRTAAGTARRGGSGPTRLARAWRALPHESRLAAFASVALFLTLFLPWYQREFFVIVAGQPHPAADTQTGWEAFSFVEAGVLLVAAGVLVLLFERAEGRAFHLPGGDGGVITAAGLWTCLLVVWRIFDKQGATSHRTFVASSGIEWGIFITLAAAAFLAYSGSRIRAAHRPEPPLPGEDRAPAGSSAAATVTRPPRSERSPRSERPAPPRRRARPARPVPDEHPASPPAPSAYASPPPPNPDRPRRRASAAELFERVVPEDPPTMRLTRRKPPPDEDSTTPMADRPESASDRERLTMPLGDDDTLRLGEDDTVRLGDDDTLPLDPKRH